MRMFAAISFLGLLLAGATAEELPAAAPETAGFSSARLAEVLQRVAEAKVPIHSLLLARCDRTILDAAFYPYEQSTLHDMASVTKSVMTSLVAIAAAEGRLELDAPMLSFFPGRRVANLDARKERVTVRQLTQNLSGLACIGYPEEVTLGQMEASADFVQFALDLPMAAEPGSRFDYCSPGMHLLSAILQQATGQTALAYGREKLFGPLGITGLAWDDDPQGVTRGWGDLHLTPHDMEKLGTMWLHGGRWDGEQIVPEQWLHEATTKAVRSDRYENYGAGFWIGPEGEPIPYFQASGRGGQRIVVAPMLQLLVVTTGGGFEPGDVIDPLVSALLDPASPLPPDAAGEAQLNQAIAALAAAPDAMPVPELPATAAQVSGKSFAVEPNPYGLSRFRVDFPGGAEASMTIEDPTGTATRPVGLDGIYRWSRGVDGVRYGATGQWTDPSTFVIDYNTIGDIRAYTITARFEGDRVALAVAQRDEPVRVELVGRVE